MNRSDRVSGFAAQRPGIRLRQTEVNSGSERRTDRRPPFFVPRELHATLPPHALSSALRSHRLGARAVRCADARARPAPHAQAPAAPRQSDGPRSAPTFTAGAGEAGQTAYRASCASCHGANLNDGAFGPPLKGVQFIQKYGGKSVEPLYTTSATRMPTTAPGSLGAGRLRADRRLHPSAERDRRRPGGTAVRSRASGRDDHSAGRLRHHGVLALHAGDAEGRRVRIRSIATRRSPTRCWPSPASSEWLGWRRTWDAHGFSPLTQITKSERLEPSRGLELVAAARDRTKVCRSCTTACCSSMAWAIACRRSMRRPATCSGNIGVSFRRACRRR